MIFLLGPLHDLKLEVDNLNKYNKLLVIWNFHFYKIQGMVFW